MKDVAQEAGVALGTVSKVFNGIPVGESYRRRVEEAAQKLGYQVNNYARGLRAGKTGTVAVILPSVDHPFFGALAQHVCAALESRNYRMLLYVTDSSPAFEQTCINLVRQNKVDGIIGLTYNPDLEVDETLPFVSIDRNYSPGVPCVTADNFSGGQIAAEKLIELGCRHLAFFRNGPVVPSEADKRGSGFEQACRLHGIDCDVVSINDGEQTLEAFRDYLQVHMDGGKLAIDGIACSTDLLAMFIRKTLIELGLRVPEDVQLIGFDGIRRFDNGAFYCSTIVQPVAQMAQACVDTLLEEDRSRLPSLICLPVSYAPGGTTRDF